MIYKATISTTYRSVKTDKTRRDVVRTWLFTDYTCNNNLDSYIERWEDNGYHITIEAYEPKRFIEGYWITTLNFRFNWMLTITGRQQMTSEVI